VTVTDFPTPLVLILKPAKSHVYEFVVLVLSGPNVTSPRISIFAEAVIVLADEVVVEVVNFIFPYVCPFGKLAGSVVLLDVL
jgi:hypothetical protein